MRRVVFALMMLLLLCGAKGPQQLGEPQKGPPLPPKEPAPKPPPAGALANPAPAAQPIAKDTLIQLYRLELGDKFNPALADKLYDAHVLLEKYFAATVPQRPAIARQLTATGLDPNLVGRIARLRMNWPQLQEGTYYVNEQVGPYHILYFLGIPKGYNRLQSWPLVVKLPDAKPFDTDPLPSVQQVVKLYDGWIKTELKSHPDAVVLMPMMNLDELWGPSSTGMNNVIQPMLHASGRVNVDPARVYLVGNGLPVWNLAIHYPTYFAAINAQSGGAGAGYQLPRLRNLRNIFSVAWHDADDKDIPVKESQDVVAALRKLKYDVDYQETKGVSQLSDELAGRLYDKMCLRTRDLYPQDVSLGSNRPEVAFNRSDWVQVYQQATSGQERSFRWLIGSGSVILYANPYDLDAKITGPNAITVTSHNVDVMRVYLNDQLVDFAKPITVRGNSNRVQFQGTIKPSMDEMLREQFTLGRGWRYFTGYVEIDYGVNTPDEPASRPVRRGGE